MAHKYKTDPKLLRKMLPDYIYGQCEIKTADGQRLRCQVRSSEVTNQMTPAFLINQRDVIIIADWICEYIEGCDKDWKPEDRWRLLSPMMDEGYRMTLKMKVYYPQPRYNRLKLKVRITVGGESWRFCLQNDPENIPSAEIRRLHREFRSDLWKNRKP